MKNKLFLIVLLLLFTSTGCQRGGPAWPRMMEITLSDVEQSRLVADRAAILKMAGTFKVSFDFEETLPMREGYELAKPYHTEAEELVIVVENRERFVSLQHLLVVRHEGQTHVINHWRQDWVYQPSRAFRWDEGLTWSFDDCAWEGLAGHWMQLVYNVADSPRYAGHGQWVHGYGKSTWTSNLIARPLPLRESAKREDYTKMLGEHRIVVGEQGWLHMQDNMKVDVSQPGPSDASVVALEMGINRYLRVPDENFEKAHDYWKNTAPFWKEVRKVWAEKFEKADELTLEARWKGDPLFTHLNGLGDEYWGQADASEAKPRIETIIDAFIVKE